MNFTPAGPLSVTCFVVIVLAVIAAKLLALWRARSSARWFALIATAYFVWLVVLAGLVAGGRMPSLPLMGFPVFFGSVLIASLAAGLSSVGKRLAGTTPLAALVGFQVFRLPLELVLHSWAAQGTIPETMTWTGQNWDIVSGIAALLAAPFANRSRAAAWTANLIGAVLLLNVMRVAILSSPFPFGWGQQPPLLLALHLPYMLIGPVCVGGALIGHIVLTRKLLSR